MANEEFILFEESVLDDKYTFRVYKDCTVEILRYSDFWVSNTTFQQLAGSRAIFALINELHDIRAKLREVARGL